MSMLSIKKLSAAAVAAVAAVAVLGFSAVTHAAPIVLPYQTFWTSGHDSNGDSYGPGLLEGQGHNSGTDNGSTGWVDETGEPTNVASVLAGNAGVQLNAAPAGGEYSDVYNSNLADHTSSNGNGVALNQATYGNFINVNYTMSITQPTIGNGYSMSSATNTFSKAGFGVEVLGANDTLIASLFTVPNPNHVGEEDVEVATGTNAAVTDAILAPPANGVSSTYSIALNFTNNTFTVFAGAQRGGTYALAAAENGIQIGGIALATDNAGTDAAVYSAFSVVPEPASLAMIGLGGLVLLARRPKRTV